MAITIIGWLFIAVGTAGLLNDLWPLLTPAAGEQLGKLRHEGFADLGPAWSLRALAIVGGVGLLRGGNWARWLLALWMLIHVAISLFHNAMEVVMHSVIFLAILYPLFRKQADGYFLASPPAAAVRPGEESD